MLLLCRDLKRAFGVRCARARTLAHQGVSPAPAGSTFSPRTRTAAAGCVVRSDSSGVRRNQFETETAHSCRYTRCCVLWHVVLPPFSVLQRIVSRTSPSWSFTHRNAPHRRHHVDGHPPAVGDIRLRRSLNEGKHLAVLLSQISRARDSRP